MEQNDILEDAYFRSLSRRGLHVEWYLTAPDDIFTVSVNKNV